LLDRGNRVSSRVRLMMIGPPRVKLVCARHSQNGLGHSRPRVYWHGDVVYGTRHEASHRLRKFM